MVRSKGVSASVALRQGLQQCLGLLQVGCVESPGKPAIDWPQQLMGFGLLALLLPESTEAHDGAQLQGFRRLAAGDVQGPL
jgi:hypothetical protein